jgi:hypothetical protein
LGEGDAQGGDSRGRSTFSRLGGFESGVISRRAGSIWEVSTASEGKVKDVIAKDIGSRCGARFLRGGRTIVIALIKVVELVKWSTGIQRKITKRDD